jgi:hypothetical protein
MGSIQHQAECLRSASGSIEIAWHGEALSPQACSDGSGNVSGMINKAYAFIRA